MAAKPPKMTGPERKHAAMLDRLDKLDFIQCWFFEQFKLKIGHNCWWLPDFMLIGQTGYVQFHEIKGQYIREDSVIKFKAAQDKYPFFGFEMWQYDGNGGKRIR